MKVVIIGAGVIGLCTAWYLKRAGAEVLVLDQGDGTDGCSFGNAGYVSPSHFVPLAAPGMVGLGLRWMFSPRSPFYFEPTLDAERLAWAWNFARHCTADHVRQSGRRLKEFSLYSLAAWKELDSLARPGFGFRQEGMLEVIATPDGVPHAQQTVRQARDLGLDARWIPSSELREWEPDHRFRAAGAVFFRDDAHLNPGAFMRWLRLELLEQGVEFSEGQPVRDFLLQGHEITGVRQGGLEFRGDVFVLAAGAWSPGLAKKLDLKLSMLPGRGYSFWVRDQGVRFRHPVILHEGRVAITPYPDGRTRLGGTMEITRLDKPPRLARVEGILASVGRFLPDLRLKMPAAEEIWSGFRPCSSDGLPYIGQASRYRNLFVGAGHAMLGMSLGPGTGKVLADLIRGRKPELEIRLFDPGRPG